MSEDEPFRWWRSPHSQRASYPIKRTEFDRALLVTPVEALRQVVLSKHTQRTPRDFFWWCGIPLPEDVGPDWAPLATVHWSLFADVTFYAVPARRRAELNRTLVTDGLPRLLGWIHEIESGAETRRTVTQRMAMFMSRGTLETIEHSGHYSHSR